MWKPFESVRVEDGLPCDEGVMPERLVVLSKLTTNDVENFEFIGLTPARGKVYYSDTLDVAVIHYGDYMRVYYNRVIEHGKTASSFSRRLRINIAPSLIDKAARASRVQNLLFQRR